MHSRPFLCAADYCPQESMSLAGNMAQTHMIEIFLREARKQVRISGKKGCPGHFAPPPADQLPLMARPSDPAGMPLTMASAVAPCFR